MAAATQTTVFLGEFETKTLLELEARPPGIYYVKIMVRCNSLLSSVFIQTADGGATVKANYFDTTTGTETTPERYELNGHDILGSANAGETHRLLVTKIHNKPILEVIVAGGSATFGVYVTAVTSTASDLDAALIRDGDTFFQETSKALPAGVLDDSDGKLYFLRGEKGVLSVAEDFGVPNPLRSGVVASIQNSTAILISQAVPALKFWRIRRLEAQARLVGYFTVWVGAVQVARSNSGPASENPKFEFAPFEVASAGSIIEVRFTQSFGPIADISAFLFVSEFDV